MHPARLMDFDTLASDVRPFIFTARRMGPTWPTTDKGRAALLRLIRPTANVLAGYAPSGRLASAHAEMDG